MKISITITKEEKNRTQNSIMLDPCTHIECGQVNCDVCPLREAAEELRKAQLKFNEVLQSIDEE